MADQVILVVDDSQEIHDILVARLRADRVVLRHALTGTEGLRMAQEVKPDLVLLDLEMSDMSGFEVCQALKGNLATSDIPVVFLTGANQLFAKVQGFELGAVDYITKPFEPVELRARVRAALRAKRYQDMLATRAQVDALTGLWNRAYFDQRLHEELAAARRYGRRVCLVIVDLDHFKRFNDECGHPFGDAVLQAVAEVLGTVRATDAACRYGGEEFALVLSEVGLPEGRAACERVRTQMADIRLEHNRRPVTVTASFGVAASDCGFQPHELTAERLIVAADDALYRAKRNGRNRVEVADEAERANNVVQLAR